MEKIVAFIPVRGGSKSIPLKNIKYIAGKPLVHWTIEAALSCDRIDKVYVCTDSDEIRNNLKCFNNPRLAVVERSPHTATDEASTESALLEFAYNHIFERIILIQATSPLLTSIDLENGLKLLDKGVFDSVFSAVRQKRFIWKENENGEVEPINYNYFKRPRRQEFDGFIVENGAFFITPRDMLLESGCRMSGKIGCVEMCEQSYYEIDEEEDWLIIEKMLEIRKRNNEKIPIKNIELIVYDFDGVMTNNKVILSEDGKESIVANRGDSLAINKIKELGMAQIIISTEKNNVVRARAQKLNLPVINGVDNKKNILLDYCKDNEYNIERVVYIGNDINDYEAMLSVGYKVCPADAELEIKEISDIILDKNGGGGVIRSLLRYLK